MFYAAKDGNIALNPWGPVEPFKKGKQVNIQDGDHAQALVVKGVLTEKASKKATVENKAIVPSENKKSRKKKAKK